MLRAQARTFALLSISLSVHLAFSSNVFFLSSRWFSYRIQWHGEWIS